jgi:chaperonin GroEL (HSP60 family)
VVLQGLAAALIVLHGSSDVATAEAKRSLEDAIRVVAYVQVTSLR